MSYYSPRHKQRVYAMNYRNWFNSTTKLLLIGALLLLGLALIGHNDLKALELEQHYNNGLTPQCCDPILFQS